jgi:hypoxanthine phosphoribosyltransferase
VNVPETRPDDMRHAMQQVKAEADCLATPAEVEAAYARMASAISARLQDANPLVFTVMTGGVIPAGQLLPRLDFPLETAYLHATRYGHALNGAELDWRVRPTHDPAGRTVLVIDDILDEGHTLAAICRELRAMGAAEVLTAVLVHKRHARKAEPDMRADFTGLEIEDRYLFGCGMDYKGYWRNAPGIYAPRGL